MIADSPPERRGGAGLALGWSLWAGFGLALAWSRLPAWRTAAGSLYASLGQAPDFSLGGLLGALGGHLIALAALAGIAVSIFGAGGAAAAFLRIPGAGLRFAFGFTSIALVHHGIGLTGLLHLPVLAVFAAACAGAGLSAARRLRVSAIRTAAQPWPKWPVFLASLMILTAFMLARLPDTHEDARVQHFAAPENHLLLHRIVAEPQNVSWHTANGAEMVVLSPWAFGGIGAAKLVNVAVLLGTCLLLAGLTGALGREDDTGEPPLGPAAWALVWYLGAGLVVDECWQGKNDIPVAMLITAAAVSAARAVRYRRERWLVGAAWFLGAAAGVKYSAGFAAVALAAPLVVALRSSVGWRVSVWMALAAAIPVGGWLAASFLFLGNPFFPFLSSVFPGPSWGPFYESGLYDFARAISPAGTWHPRDCVVGVWRVLGEPAIGSPALFAMLPLALLQARGRAAGLVKVAALLAILLWLPTARVARYLFPIVPLLAGIAGLAAIPTGRLAGGVFRATRSAAAIVAMSVVALNAAALAAPTGWRVLLGQMSVPDFLSERFTTWDEMRRWANDNLPSGARILMTGEERRLWFRRRVISYSSVGEPIFWKLTRESFTIGEMRKRVRQRGITHRIHNFASSEYRRLAFWPGPPWDARQLGLFRDYVRFYEKPVYVPGDVNPDDGGFHVFEMLRDRHPEGMAVMFLPFTEGNLRKAADLVRRGMMAEATAEAERVLAPVRDTFCAQLSLAALAARRNDHAEVVRLLLPGIRAGYVANGNWVYYGVALHELGRYDESVTALCRAHMLCQRCGVTRLLGEALTSRGRLRIDRGRLREAVRDLDLAARLRPGDPLVLRYAAEARRGLDRRTGTSDATGRRVAREPRDFESHAPAERPKRISEIRRVGRRAGENE